MPRTETATWEIQAAPAPPQPWKSRRGDGARPLSGALSPLEGCYCLDGSLEDGSPKVAQIEMPWEGGFQGVGEPPSIWKQCHGRKGYGRPATATGPAPRSAWMRSWERLCPFPYQASAIPLLAGSISNPGGGQLDWNVKPCM